MESMKEFTRVTSMHGLKFLFEAGFARRIAWFLLLCAACGLLIWQVYKQSLQFRNNPTTTSINIKHNDQLDFPAITICNANQMKITKVAALGVYGAINELFGMYKGNLLGDFMANDFPKLYRQKFSVKNLGNTTNFTVLNWQQIKALKKLEAEFNDSRAFHKHVKHEEKDMFLKLWKTFAKVIKHFRQLQTVTSAKQTLRFNGCTDNRGNACNATAMFTDIGICYIIKYGTKYTLPAKNSGYFERIDVVLNLEEYEYAASEMATAGFLIGLTKPGFWPMMKSNSLTIRAGPASIFMINHKKKELLSKSDYGKHGLCIENKKLKFFAKESYSFETCQYNSQLQNIARICKCNPMNSPTFTNICSVSEHFLCVIPMNSILRVPFDKGSLAWRLTKGMDDTEECISGCNQEEYAATISYLDLPMKTLKTFVKEGGSNRSISYNNMLSQESQARLNPMLAAENNDMIQTMTKAYQTLESFGLGVAQTPMDMVSPRDHMQSVSQCFKDILNDTEFLHLIEYSADDGEMRKISSGDINDYFDEKFMRLFFPDTVVNSIQAGYAEFVGDREIVANIEKEIDLVANFFAEGEMQTPVPASDKFVSVFSLMAQYKNNIITKKRWAMLHAVQHLNGLGMEYKGMIEDLTGILNEHNRTAYEFESVADGVMSNSSYYSSNFWSLVQYSYFLKRAANILQHFGQQNSSICSFSEFINFKDIFDVEAHYNASFVQSICLCKIKLPVDLKDLLSAGISCIQNISDTGILAHTAGKYNKLADKFIDATKTLDDNLAHYFAELEDVDAIYKKNIAYASFSFRDMSTEILKQQISYDIWSLFSDIGGTLGLFLGASVMTFCEILDWICTGSGKSVKSVAGRVKKRKKRVDNSAPQKKEIYTTPLDQQKYENDMKLPSPLN